MGCNPVSFYKQSEVGAVHCWLEELQGEKGAVEHDSTILFEDISTISHIYNFIFLFFFN